MSTAAPAPPDAENPKSPPALVTVSPNASRKSIRSSSDSAGGPPDLEPEDTFHQLLSIHVDQPVGSMSISPSNRDVALGARKGLYIVDLQNPYDPPRFLPHHSPWDVADVQWNPFPARSEWVVSTSAKQAVVYNLSFSPSFSSSHIEHTLNAHTRAVTDINWSPGSPEVLATCALDGWVWSWDLRTGYGSKNGAGGGRKPVWGVCSWGSGATQVKWNRREPHIIASAHDNKVMIWDDRMGAAPVTEIHGHSAKIYGIDWSRKDSKKLVTCSLDKSFKSWNFNNPSTSLLTVETSSPVWRARFLPFGEGVLTLPQRSDHGLSIWGREKVERGDTAEPVARFEGAREGVKEFVWRTRGGQDLENDDRQFQLVTWAKDRRLRLWPISDEILKEVGHQKGAKIDIPMTRRGGPDISYRTFSETPAPVVPFSLVSSPPVIPRHLAPGSSLLSASLTASPPTPSLLTSSLLAASFSAGPSPLSQPPPPPREPARTAATMTTTSARNRRQKAHDRLAWMEGVKVLKPPMMGEGDGSGDTASKASNAGGTGTEGVESTTHTRSSSLVRGTDAGTAREGGETERAESVMSPGSARTGTAVGREVQHTNLGEEITSVVRRFPRVNFEKVHVAGRTCTVSLYSPLFLRATFTFPKNYPHSAAPTIELERNADITLKSRAFILQSMRKLMAARTQRGLPSLELALRFLLGDRSSLSSKPQEEDDDDDDADDVVSGQGLGAVAAEILRNNFNVPPPRRGGAVFGPQGQLVVFFPTNVFISHATPDRVEPSGSGGAEPPTSSAKPLRLSEAFGNLHAEPLDSLHDGDYQETDEALQMATAHSVRTSAIHRPRITAAVEPSDQAPSFSTIVHIKDVSHLTLTTPSRIMAELGGTPIDVTRDAVARATAVKDLFLAKVWTTLVGFFEAAGTARPLETLFVEKLLPELLSFLVQLKDIQTLGIIACLLESYSRSVTEDHSRPKPPSRSPTDDYFSHRVAPSTGQSSGSGYDSARTPLASASGYRMHSGTGQNSSHSPKPSWANLSGFFNTSVLSLRAGSPSTPGSPDRPTLHSRTSSSVAPHHSPSSPHLSPLPLKSPMRNFQQQAQYRSSDSLNSQNEKPSLPPAAVRQPSRGRTRGSPNVTFGTTSVALINGKGVVSTPASMSPRLDGGGGLKKRVAVKFSDAFALHKPVPWWLTESAQLELELIRLAYAELLYRWGLHHERLQVLKMCRSSPDSASKDFGVIVVRAGNGLTPNTTIEIGRSCQRCGANNTTPQSGCQICHRRPRALLCSLCHLPVEALSQNCTICCHVGHLRCLEEWYKTEDACPTGCGCRCPSEQGTAGVFLVPAPQILSPISRPKNASWGMRSSLPFLY